MNSTPRLSFEEFLLKRLSSVNQDSVDQVQTVTSPRRKPFQISELTSSNKPTMSKAQSTQSKQLSLPKLGSFVTQAGDLTPSPHKVIGFNSFHNSSPTVRNEQQQDPIMKMDTMICPFHDKMKRKNDRLTVLQIYRLQTLQQKVLEPQFRLIVNEGLKMQPRKAHKPTQSLALLFDKASDIPKTRRNHVNSVHVIKKIDYQGEHLFNRILADPIIGPYFSGRPNLEALKVVHQTLLDTLHGGTLHFNIEYIRGKHQNLMITDNHFFQMKKQYILFLLENKVPAQQIQNCAHKMELYRPYIVNQANLYESLGKEAGILQVATKFHKQVLADYILNVHFDRFDMKHRYQILNKIVGQILNIFETPQMIRQFHSGQTITHYISMNLTHVHFTQFKFYLSQSLYMSKIPASIISKIFVSLDQYKSCILDKDSLLELIEKEEGGLPYFLTRFHKICTDEPVVQMLIAKKGLQQFIQHAELVFHFLLDKQPVSVHQNDVVSLLQSRVHVPIKVINAIKAKTYQFIEVYNPDYFIFEDFKEKVEELQEQVLGHTPYLDLNSPQTLSFIKAVTYEIQQMPILIKIYNDCDVEVGNNIIKKLFCLGSKQRHYRRTDIQNIHQHFKIHNYTFDQFLTIFKEQTVKHPEFRWLIPKIESYRAQVVNE